LDGGVDDGGGVDVGGQVGLPFPIKSNE
jgi:hypothetical protein